MPRSVVYISATSYSEFVREWRQKKDKEWSGLRYGQAFYNYYDMHKMTPRPELNLLYQSDDRGFVEQFIDWNN